MKLTLVPTLMIVALTATVGCSKKSSNTNLPGGETPAQEVQKVEPTAPEARIESETNMSETEYVLTITLPLGEQGAPVSFTGSVASNGETVLLNEGLPDGRLEVATLDDFLGTLVVVFIDDSEKDEGSAYVFKRVDLQNDLVLDWKQENLTTLQAMQVDTIMKLSGVSLEVALEDIKGTEAGSADEPQADLGLDEEDGGEPTEPKSERKARI